MDQTSLENISSRYLYYFTIISIRSTCKVRLNYPVTEQVGTAFKLRQRMKNLTLEPLNLVGFTFSFGRGWRRNVLKFKTHVQELGFSH